jgi:hypothetical protein
MITFLSAAGYCRGEGFISNYSINSYGPDVSSLMNILAIGIKLECVIAKENGRKKNQLCIVGSIQARVKLPNVNLGRDEFPPLSHPLLYGRCHHAVCMVEVARHPPDAPHLSKVDPKPRRVFELSAGPPAVQLACRRASALERMKLSARSTESEACGMHVVDKKLWRSAGS